MIGIDECHHTLKIISSRGKTLKLKTESKTQQVSTMYHNYMEDNPTTSENSCTAIQILPFRLSVFIEQTNTDDLYGFTRIME